MDQPNTLKTYFPVHCCQFVDKGKETEQRLPLRHYFLQKCWSAYISTSSEDHLISTTDKKKQDEAANVRATGHSSRMKDVKL